jgi:hypothetical protein
MNQLSSPSEALWKGGHYEIKFELGAPPNERLRVALEALRSYTSLAGCFLSRQSSFADRAKIDPGTHVHALALIGFEADFPRVTCESVRRNGIPSDRFENYLWNEDGQLKWYPPTNLHVVRFVNWGSGSEK